MGLAWPWMGFRWHMGFATLTLFIAQIMGVLGWGVVFPWSVPALYSGAAGSQGSGLGPLSYALVVLTLLAGLADTLAWWNYVEQGA
jgi:predicted ribosomally synthesized peptide with SipW-like signal peptide